MKKYVLHIVTGAPASGKTTSVEAFIRRTRGSDYVAFDVDWLAEPATDLACKDIFTDPSTWKPYGDLWFEVLHGVCRNGKIPVLFTPTDPSDVREFGKPIWCKRIEWLLLDCDDETRRQRLEKRRSWTEDEIQEAIADAKWLRQQGISRHVDTSHLSPAKVSAEILEWLETTRQGE